MSRTVRRPDPYPIFAEVAPWKITRDRKPWYKPPSWYKKMRRRERRSQDRNALQRIVKNGDGEMPIHKHTDMWDWS